MMAERNRGTELKLKLRAHLVYVTQTCDIGHMTIDHFLKMG